MRPLIGQSEVPVYVDLHQEVFGTRNMNPPWRSRTLKQAGYESELDILVFDPLDRAVAFCIGWLDRRTARGQIEPLGCLPEYRRFALGRTALSEVLRRLQSMGAREVFVETDADRNTAMSLYEHMGFKPIQEVHEFRKDFLPH
jgi:ribosomal protein S18 acetylase RimI-like enzyme